MFVSPRNPKNWHENYSSTLQGKMFANEVTMPKKHVKPSLQNCKVCGITTQINARAVISNPPGKTNLEKNFQAYCKYGIVFWKGPPVLFTRYLRSFCHIAKLGLHRRSSHYPENWLTNEHAQTNDPGPFSPRRCVTGGGPRTGIGEA